ncbi:lipopolysaccharide biosynthesis protein [Roseateles toxinivorans]|uniref:O-antigen/teichoic acid export membrane protein n=1 Tax=Roseateles toxinivorans TaxID=270368 RepID=A0A4V3CTY6_9BURK|nr:lipopolysaccharide biosynthesis protein [Roseateles toxinivorans]TDP74618.1 O-antigen/teichoic acid export membrane protein [Roseateles toxinivorans]
MSKTDQGGNLGGRLASGVKWAALSRITSQSISWLVTLIIIRLLHPHDYGLNAMIEVPIELCLLFSSLGIDAALIRFGRYDEKQLSSAFGVLLIANGLIFAMLQLSADLIALYFGEPRLAPLIRVSATIFLLAPFRIIPNALLDAALDFKLKSQIEMIAAFVASVLSLILALSGAGVWALVAVVVINPAIRVALLAYWLPWIIRPAFRFQDIRHLIGYGSVVLAGSVMAVLSARVITLLAGPKLGAEMMGVYAVATVFSLLPMSKMMPIVNQTLYPAFAQSKHDAAGIERFLLKSVSLTALIIFPLTIGMACVAASIVPLVFGKQWGSVIQPLAILCLLMPVKLMGELFSLPINATGKAKYTAKIQLFGLIVSASGVLYAAEFGLIGLTALAALNILLVGGLSVLFSCRLFGISARKVWASVSSAIFGCALMALSLIFIDRNWGFVDGWLGLICQLITAAMIYIGVVLIQVGPRGLVELFGISRSGRA